MFRRRGRRGAVLPSVAVLLLAATACRCTGGGSAGEGSGDARDGAEPGCDAAWCTSACLASGAECGRCVEDVGCRCNADCMEPVDHCPPEAVRWDDLPIWERSLDESWAFDPPRWDVSGLRYQPQPGCELISLTGTDDPPPWPGRPEPSASTWVSDRYVALHDLVTRCVDGWPMSAEAIFLLDTTTWTMSLVYVEDPRVEGGPGCMAVFDGGIVYSVVWFDPCGEDCGTYDPRRIHQGVVVYSVGDGRQKEIWRHDRERTPLSLHASGPRVLHQYGWEDSSFSVFDTESETWSPLATFGGRGVSGVWHVDFSGERAVWDVWSGGGIMTAVLSRPEETFLIGYSGAKQWSPGVSGDLVCWNERPRDGCPQLPRECPGEAIRCADLGTGEVFIASADLPADFCLILDGPGQSVVSVSGPWVAYHAIRCDEDLSAVYRDRTPSSVHSRLFHRELGRSFALSVRDAPVGAYLVTGHYVVIGYYPWWDGAVMPKGLYRCDLRVLFPEAYAEPGGPDGG